MAVNDIYLPLSVGFARDPKIRALMYQHGQDGILAAYLYIMMCLYCKENLTDGWVPIAEVPALGYPMSKQDAERYVSALETAGLITTSAGSNAVSIRVSAYVKRNGTRRDVEARSDQARSASRIRWRNHEGHRAESDPVSGPIPKTETESIKHPSHVAEPDARARDGTHEGEKLDLAQITIWEVKELTGGLQLDRTRAAEIVAELIGDRRLTSPAAYLRRALRAHPDLFGLVDPAAAPAVKAGRKRRVTAADTPAAEAAAAAATADGRARATPATAEQRKAHADAARAAIMAKSTPPDDARPTEVVTLPDDPGDEPPF